MRPAWLILFVAQIMHSAVDFKVTYCVNIFPGDITIMCSAWKYDHQSPLYARLIVEKVEQPIISAKFYGLYDGLPGNISNDTSISKDSCYTVGRANEEDVWNETFLPCFTSWELKVNDNFWWCGFIAERCSVDDLYETRIIFTIRHYLTFPFIHLGNYTCQIEQNGTVRNSTHTIDKGIRASCCISASIKRYIIYLRILISDQSLRIFPL